MKKYEDNDAAVKKEMSETIEQDLTGVERAFFYAYLVGHLSTQVSQGVWHEALLSAQKHILERRVEAMEAENKKLKKAVKAKAKA